MRILTNALSSTDVSVVQAGYSRYRKALLRMGVELYELNMNLDKWKRFGVDLTKILPIESRI